MFSLTPAESLQTCLLNLECMCGLGRVKETMERRKKRLLNEGGTLCHLKTGRGIPRDGRGKLGKRE